MTEAGFLKIAITLPDLDVTNEAERIVDMLRKEGYDYIHIRKPGASIRQIRILLDSIPKEYHSRLWLNDAQALAKEYDVAGIHINSRLKEIPRRPMCVTAACHSIQELDATLPFENVDVEYRMLSPIYDSISKPGYSGRFNLEEIAPQIKGKRIVALGGVTPDKFPELQKAGFIGAAMLGAAWKNN